MIHTALRWGAGLIGVVALYRAMLLVAAGQLALASIVAVPGLAWIGYHVYRGYQRSQTQVTTHERA